MQSLVASCQISNSFGILWLFWLPVRTKKNQFKMKGLMCSQDFPHFNPIRLLELSVAMETRVLIRLIQLFPIAIMLQMKFDFEQAAGIRDINV